MSITAESPNDEKIRDECDLVMKGGITSGVVYPPLVLLLKDKYHFRSVGGTSAGAIAAAATAAAEYGRERNGFDKLDALTRQLSRGTFLRDLFQPSRKTRPLMDTLLYLTENWKKEEVNTPGTRPSKGEIKRLFQYLPTLDNALKLNDPTAYAKGSQIGFDLSLVVVAFITGLSLLVLLLRHWIIGGEVGWWLVLVPLVLLIGPVSKLGCKLGGMFNSVLDLYKILTIEVPKNFLGMCTGRPDDVTNEDLTVLTDWLNDKIDDLAGINEGSDYKPLTFGDLKSKKFGDKRDKCLRKEDNITLRMVTSNLSQNQPCVLPFKDQLFIFNREEFLRSFPRRVVDYLASPDTPRTTEFILPDNYYFLPEADALPVIVATRLSLSFPLLLSAVPLYAIKIDTITAVRSNKRSNKLNLDDLQRNWFSDGGICSNFPIQFFDEWLPTRPTFGVNLTSLPKHGLTEDKTHVKTDCLSPTSSEATQPTLDAIYLPHADEPLVTEYVPFEDAPQEGGSPGMPSLFRFLWSIFSTAQNYRDNAQSVLPSYRERIVQIRLSDDEGGLNLAMTQNTIEEVIGKGRKAGEELLKFDFDVHQWVRFRVLMRRIEESLVSMNKVISKHAFYRSLLALPSGKPEYPFYPNKEDWLSMVAARLAKVGDEIKRWDPPNLFAEEPSPLPEPVLRITPEL